MGFVGACLSHSVRTLAALGLDLLYPRSCCLCGCELWSWRQEPVALRYVCASCRDRLAVLEAPLCRVCGRPLGSQGANGDPLMCHACRCRRKGRGISWMRSGFFLKGGARDLLHRFKYDGEIWLAGDIGALIRRQIEPELDPAGWDVLLPTPLHSRRLKKRGFNQAEEMARALSRAWGIPVLKGAVRRDRMTEKQALLTAAGRRRNVVGAFRVRRPGCIAGKRVLLVDDVTTTGATLGELASVLRRLPRDQRPLEIGAVTFARGGF